MRLWLALSARTVSVKVGVWNSLPLSLRTRSSFHVEEIVAQLADPIDVDRDSQILERYGLSRDYLMDRMGASP